MYLSTLFVPILAALSQIDVVNAELTINTDPHFTNTQKSLNTATTRPPASTNTKSWVSSWQSSMTSIHNAGRTTPKPKTTAKKTSSTKKALTTKKALSTKKPSSTKKTTLKTSVRKKTTTTAKAKATAVKKVRAESRNALVSRDNTGCSALELNMYNYIPTDQSPTGYQVNSLFSSLALGNYVPPPGYTTSFLNNLGANVLDSYFRYVQLASYNTSACAAICNTVPECMGFNIYYLRNPLYTPNNTTCTNPDARAAITCSLFKTSIYAASATNFGLWKNDFLVTTSGSNGYNRDPSPPKPYANFSGPVALPGAVAGTSSPYFLGSAQPTGDESGCPGLCQSLTASNRAAAIKAGSTSYSACNYWNSFNTSYAGASQGIYCLFYSNSNVAATSGYTNTAQQTISDGTQVILNITLSYGFTLYPQDSGLTSKTWAPAPTGTAASCSSLSGGVNGKSVVDYNNVNYTMLCGYDLLYAGDVGNATAPDFYSCYNLCDNFSGCSGFSYSYGVCWFKNVAGLTKTPTATSGVDFAYMTNKYAGLNAGQIAATVSYTTYTTVWTGKSTATSTSMAGLTGYIIIKTPGVVPTSATTYTTTYIDSGTSHAITTSTAPFTAGASVVSVTVIYPTPPTTCGNSGAKFAMYTNSWPGGQNTASYPAFTPQVYKTIKPSPTGIASYIAETNNDGGSMTMYGLTGINGNSLVMDHTFYVYAGRGTGYYSLTIPYTDDIQFVWVGNKAMSGWNRTNSDLLQFWSQSTQTATTVAFYLQFDTFTPVRVMWGNGGGQGDMRFSLFAPDGTTLLASTPGQNAGYMSPNIVTSPCNSALGAPFPAWGSET